jgi:hypothetical protein
MAPTLVLPEATPVRVLLALSGRRRLGFDPRATPSREAGDTKEKRPDGSTGVARALREPHEREPK